MKTMPTQEEVEAIMAHAESLGMDPIEDSAFRWLAEESLKAPMPPGWEIITGGEDGEDGAVPFYYNEALNQSTWEHPLDEVYRARFQKLKKAATAAVAGGAAREEQSVDKSGEKEEEEEDIASLEEIREDIESLSDGEVDETNKPQQQQQQQQQSPIAATQPASSASIPVSFSISSPPSPIPPSPPAARTSNTAESTALATLRAQVASMQEERTSLQDVIARLQGRLERERMDWEEEANRRVMVKEKELQARVAKAVEAAALEWQEKVGALKEELEKATSSSSSNSSSTAVTAGKSQEELQQLRQLQQEEEEQSKKMAEIADVIAMHRRKEAEAQAEAGQLRHCLQDKEEEIKSAKEKEEESRRADRERSQALQEMVRRGEEKCRTLESLRTKEQKAREAAETALEALRVSIDNTTIPTPRPDTSSLPPSSPLYTPRIFPPPTTTSTPLPAPSSSSSSPPSSSSSSPSSTLSSTTRIVALELSLEIERLKVHKATAHERLYQAQRYEQELQTLKNEISLRLPLLAAAAVKHAQEAAAVVRPAPAPAPASLASAAASGSSRASGAVAVAAAAAAAAAAAGAREDVEKIEEESEERGEDGSEHLIMFPPARLSHWPRHVMAEGGGSSSAALMRRRGRGGNSSTSRSSNINSGKGTLAMQLLQEWRRENQVLRKEIAELRSACVYQLPIPCSTSSFSSYPFSSSDSSSPPPFYFTARPILAGATAAAAAAARPSCDVGAVVERANRNDKSSRSSSSSSSSSSVRGVDLETWRRKYGCPVARK